MDTKSALLQALEAKETSTATLLILEGKDPNANEGEPLVQAVRTMCPELVTLLLLKGAEPTLKGLTKKSPLIEAIYSSDNKRIRATVPLMLGKGADPNDADQEGKSALVLALQLGYTDIAILLIEKGADPNAINEEGTPVLIMAIEGKFEGIATLLIEKGAKPNETEQCPGTMPLHLAIRGGLVSLAVQLLGKGADIDAEDDGQRTALDVAREVELPALSQIISYMSSTDTFI